MVIPQEWDWSYRGFLNWQFKQNIFSSVACMIRPYSVLGVMEARNFHQLNSRIANPQMQPERRFMVDQKMLGVYGPTPKSRSKS